MLVTSAVALLIAVGPADEEAPPPSDTPVARPVARPDWKVQLDRGTPRISLGFQGGRHLGFALWGDWQFWNWKNGEFGVGGIFATHFLFQRDPRRPQPGVEINGADVAVNIAPMLGHTLRFAKRRLHWTTAAYAGISIRSIHAEVDDPAHEFTQRSDTEAVYADLGAMTSIGVRFGRFGGINIDGAVPLFVGPNGYGFPAQWTITGPWVGLSLTHHFY